MSSIRVLTDLLLMGRRVSDGALREALKGLFGERIAKAAEKDVQIRDAYTLGRDGDEGGIPWAGLINPDNPTSGPYGGTSLVWFPSEAGSLVGLGIGTRGISPDEGILTRPGHKRRVAGLRAMLAKEGVLIWSKADPAALGVAVPKSFVNQLPEFAPTFKRYSNEMYCVARLPDNLELAEKVVSSFVDLYAFERGWKPLSSYAKEFDDLQSRLRGQLFVVPTAQEIAGLVRARRFVILQGAPGTGKTRLAGEVMKLHFGGRGMTTQFHPSVTYEDFVIGLSPDAKNEALRFKVRYGALLEAAARAGTEDFLLLIDEINRADLGKVLGEAIYLFEPDEIGGTRAREVRLPHPFSGQDAFRFPESLYVLGTMNTADRSIANLDLAIRRRFAFVTVPPNRTAIQDNSPAAALQFYDELSDLFVEHAPEDALALLPGQSYFIAKDEKILRSRIRFDLVPLLDDYLRLGLLGVASVELQALRDRFEDMVT